MEKTGWKVFALVLLTGYIVAAMLLIILLIIIVPVIREVVGELSGLSGGFSQLQGQGSGPGGQGGFPSAEQMKQFMEQGGPPGSAGEASPPSGSFSGPGPSP